MGMIRAFSPLAGLPRERTEEIPSESTSAVVYTPVTSTHRRIRHMAIDAVLWSLALVIVWSVQWDEWRGRRAQPQFSNALDAIYPDVLEADHAHE